LPRAAAAGAVDRRAVVCWLGAALVLAGLGAWLRSAGPDLAWFHAVNGADMGSPMLWSSLCVLGLGLSGFVVVAALSRTDTMPLACLAWSILIGTLLTHGPKRALDLHRPARELGVQTVHVIGEPVIGSGSMPSGHALTAFTLCTLLWFTMRPPSRNRWLPLTLLLAVGVAWSRVAVSAHWPSDVLVGAGLGIVTALLACAVPHRVAAYGRATRRMAAGLATRAGQCTVAALEIIAAVGMLTQHTGYPLGWPLQWGLALVAAVSAGWRLRHLPGPQQ
jgi:membrane-associated phospholipid phosphatase